MKKKLKLYFARNSRKFHLGAEQNKCDIFTRKANTLRFHWLLGKPRISVKAKVGMWVEEAVGR